MKKVLVQSTMREVVAKVGQTPARNHAGAAVMVPTLRAFHNYRCYMLPEEAEFLVEGETNRRERAVGKASYFFPAGFPVPVDENHEGPLAPAMSAEGLSTSADPKVALAAKNELLEAERVLTAREKGQGTAMDEQLGAKKAVKQPVATG
jgi:hypothetical protein